MALLLLLFSFGIDFGVSGKYIPIKIFSDKKSTLKSMRNIYIQRNKLRVIINALCLIIFFNRSVSQEPVLSLTPLVNGLDQPMQLVNAGDGTNRIFVVHRSGAITVFDQSFTLIGTFLTVTDVNTLTEDGLLSMAFHPDYGDALNSFFGYFFVYYTSSITGNLEIARYQVSSGDPNVANPAKTIILSIPHSADFHNGGTIQFGNDGYLYLGTGDGGPTPEEAQDETSLLGKMLRIDVNTSTTFPFYTIPPGNPYGDEIWALGFRNPFRWDFDRATGDIWITDVGEDGWEEINYTVANSTAGINYGWQCYEGNAQWVFTGCTSSYTSPAYAYANTGTASVIGGTVYRGTAVLANAPLQGYYLAADHYTGNIYKIKPNGPGWTTYIQPGLLTRIVNFGEAENGELYVVSLRDNLNTPSSGAIYEIVVSDVLPVVLVEFAASSNNGVVHLNWNTSSEQNLQQFEIEYGIDGNSFIRAGIVPALNATTGSEYKFSHEPSLSGRIFYRLKMTDFDGQFKYSGIITTNVSRSTKNFVQPSVITSGMINAYVNNSFNTLELISMNGAVLLKQNIKGRTGKIDIPLPLLTTGTYIVQLRNNKTIARQLILIR